MIEYYMKGIFFHWYRKDLGQCIEIRTVFIQLDNKLFSYHSSEYDQMAIRKLTILGVSIGKYRSWESKDNETV